MPTGSWQFLHLITLNFTHSISHQRISSLMHLVEDQVHIELERLVSLKHKRQRRLVRFVDSPLETFSQAPVQSELSIDEIRNRWYCQSDFQRFKQTAHLICRESQASPLVGLLRDSYSSAQHQLDLWAVHGRSLRGLERSINRAHVDWHKTNRRKNCDAVLDAQDKLRKVGVDNAAAIAEVASATSMQAREFAIRMGLADYRACLQDSLLLPSVNARRQSSYLRRPDRPPCLTEWSRRPSQISLESRKPC